MIEHFLEMRDFEYAVSKLSRFKGKRVFWNHAVLKVFEHELRLFELNDYICICLRDAYIDVLNSPNDILRDLELERQCRERLV